MKLSVVLPVFNEAENLLKLRQYLDQVTAGLGVDYEYIFVNDGSADESLQLLKDMARKDPGHIHYLSFSRNFGQQTAFQAGLDVASGDRIVLMDADLQDPPSVIARMWAKMDEGYDVVFGQRRRHKGHSLPVRMLAFIFYRFLRKSSSIAIPLDTGDFRIFNRKILHILRQMPEADKFLRGQIAWAGFRQAAVLYDRPGRNAGKSGYSFWKLAGLAFSGITGFTLAPLRWVFFTGLILFTLGLIGISGMLVEQMLDYPGWFTVRETTSSIIFIGGVQLLATGILGQYLGRILRNTNRRPPYVIAESSFRERAEGRTIEFPNEQSYFSS